MAPGLFSQRKLKKKKRFELNDLFSYLLFKSYKYSNLKKIYSAMFKVSVTE